MDSFISSVEFTDQGPLLKISPELVGLLKSSECPQNVAEAISWLNDHFASPILLVTDASNDQPLKQFNDLSPFAYFVQRTERDRSVDSSNSAKTEFELNTRFESSYPVLAESEKDRNQATASVSGGSSTFPSDVQSALKESKKHFSLSDNILHDLNNLLLVIYFSSNDLVSQLSKDAPVRRAADAIQEARKQATILTRQLQDHLHAASKELEDINVDLNELIVNSEKFFRRLTRGDVILTVNLSSSPAIVSANPDKADRIILNLVLNALSAVSNGGWVTVETCHENVKDNDQQRNRPSPGHYIRLTVSDTGSDFETSEEPDEIPSDRDASFVLPIVRRIVNQCGGWIDITTSSENGTRVDVRLPAATGNTETKDDEIDELETPEVTGHRKTILLVEDEAYIRQFVMKLLVAQGYDVVEADDGVSALAAICGRSEPFDLLIADMLLPGMSGRDIAQKLQQEDPNLPVLFISGLDSEDVMTDQPQKAPISFLKKPFKTADLLSRVREMVNQRSEMT